MTNGSRGQGISVADIPHSGVEYTTSLVRGSPIASMVPGLPMTEEVPLEDKDVEFFEHQLFEDMGERTKVG